MRCRRDDRAVSEVLGFVLSFALSAVFLMIALTSFYAAKNNTDSVVVAVELRSIADRVAGGVIEAGLMGQEFPNATFNLTLAIPFDLQGAPYYVNATKSQIYVNASSGEVSASASTLKLDAVTGFEVSGRVESSAERVIITYSLLPSGSSNIKNIRIHGD